jgi:hypothetical protein
MKYKDTDIDEWPASWAVFPEDVRYGKQILPDMKGFIESLKRKELSVKTVNRYIDALWLLGGKIIDAVNNEEKNRTKEPVKLLLEMIDEEGGPLMDCSEDQAAFDRTCKKFYRFLQDTYLKPAWDSKHNALY